MLIDNTTTDPDAVLVNGGNQCWQLPELIILSTEITATGTASFKETDGGGWVSS
jgi:hypothetical protein